MNLGMLAIQRGLPSNRAPYIAPREALEMLASFTPEQLAQAQAGSQAANPLVGRLHNQQRGCGVWATDANGNFADDEE